MWVAAGLLVVSAVFNAVWLPRRREAIALEGELDRSELVLVGAD